MADSTSVNLSKFSNKCAFVVGYTGEVGKELVRELLEKKIFKKLVLIGRRQVTYDNPLYVNCEQKIVNFDELENNKEAFQGCDYGFCCLGTTRGVSGAAGFVKVDHDYVVAVAKIAHETGCQHFTVVSALGADKNSIILLRKTKGLMEEHVSQVPFPRLTILRPAGLLCDRQETRIAEKVAFFVLKPISWAKPTLLTVPTTTVAKAIIYNMLKEFPNESKELLNNQNIHDLGAEYDKAFSAPVPIAE